MLKISFARAKLKGLFSMFDSILNSLMPISLVFELCALALSFYLKDSRIFFIVLAVLCSRLTYLYASFLQAHLFVSLFLPFVFVLFVVMRRGVLVFEKKSLAKLAVLGFVGILALILSKSTNFNAAMSERLFELPFSPISELGVVFFGAELVFLVFWGLFKNEMHFAAAFVLLFVQFFFDNSSSFFEFASLFFVFYMLWHSYKSLYYDTFTKLPNQKALKRKLLGLESFYLGGLRMSGFEALDLKNTKILFKKIGKILRKQAKNAQIFRVDDDFIFLFSEFDEDRAGEFLRALQRGFENTNLGLKNVDLRLKFTSTLIKNQERFEDNLTAIKEALAPIKRG